MIDNAWRAWQEWADCNAKYGSKPGVKFYTEVIAASGSAFQKFYKSYTTSKPL